MFENANPARDAFTFSLGGMAAINSYAITPVVANDRINKTWDRRLARAAQDWPARPQPGLRIDKTATMRCGHSSRES